MRCFRGQWWIYLLCILFWCGVIKGCNYYQAHKGLKAYKLPKTSELEKKMLRDYTNQ